MCPTLEQILSRSLMRGKYPVSQFASKNFSRGGGSQTTTTQATSTTTSSSGVSPVPNLKVPMMRSPHHAALEKQKHQQEQESSGGDQQQQFSSSAAATRQPHTAGEAVVAAFSSLASKPIFEPDKRPQIKERPDKKGLRSLQDLPSFLNSAVALGEYQSAVDCLKEGYELAMEDAKISSNQNHNIIRQNISVELIASVAKICPKETTKSSSSFFENAMDEMILQQQKENQQEQEQEQDNNYIQQTAQQEWSELTTEALAKSGNWITALERYNRLCFENFNSNSKNNNSENENKNKNDDNKFFVPVSVGSLNSCISGLVLGKQWMAALELAEPAMENRTRIEMENLNAAVSSSSSTSTAEENSENNKMNEQEEENNNNSNSAVPLSSFGSQNSNSNNSQQQQKTKSSSSSSDIGVVADAVTYATLISTLESCGQSKIAQKVLERTPSAERKAVLTSYVALMQVWSDSHMKKSMRRF